VKFALVQMPLVVVLAPPLPLCRWQSLIQKLKRRSQWYLLHDVLCETIFCCWLYFWLGYA